MEVFLRSKAKELKSDFNDVPQWVIEASNEFIEKLNGHLLVIAF